jgi:hypothetical protein
VILQETSILDVPPERVVAFLEALEHRYLDWHPDHISFSWLDGAKRDHFYFEERIGGWMIRMPVQITRSADGRMAVCRPSTRIVRWVFPWMTFSAHPEGNGCRYTHRIKLRLGPARWLLERRLLPALRQHMREETANLGGLLAPSDVA